jgi:hypothetical protein
MNPKELPSFRPLLLIAYHGIYTLGVLTICRRSLLLVTWCRKQGFMLSDIGFVRLKTLR